jgi:trk system potassium uptake protein TrkH
MNSARSVSQIIGALLILLGVFMLAPMITDFVTGSDEWRSFATASALTLFAGAILMLVARGGQLRMNLRAAFILTTFSWAIMAVFATLPFILSQTPMSFTDAYFESMSGLTTTGSTVMSGLDDMPKGILLWRAILQWIGGVGIIIVAMAVLPMLKVGGMQLFRAEWFEPMGKVLPRAQAIAIGIGAAYVGLTILCAGVYWMLGVDAFDAICLSMTTLSTGGFANSDASFAAYADGGADIAGSIFMTLAALPFATYILAVRGDISSLWRNAQTRGFLGLLAVVIIGMSLYMEMTDHEGMAHPIRLAMFNVISITTGTGYGFGDYQLWGPIATPVFFVLMFIGGCAGSTSCSIKIFRFQVAIEGLRVFVRKMLNPHLVSPLRYNGVPLPESALYSVLNFFFVFFACFALATLALSFAGLDTTTAISSAATSITNVGPGLGNIVGPAGNFSPLPDVAKWVMSITMLVGRLELFTVLVLFLPRFWIS